MLQYMLDCMENHMDHQSIIRKKGKKMPRIYRILFHDSETQKMEWCMTPSGQPVEYTEANIFTGAESWAKNNPDVTYSIVMWHGDVTFSTTPKINWRRPQH